MDPDSTPEIRVRVELLDASIPPGHQLAERMVTEFVNDARDCAEIELEIAHEVVAGRKGAIDQVLLGLGPAGIVAFTRIVRLWLQRDRHREMHVTVDHQNGALPLEIHLAGENLSQQDLQKGLTAALELETERRSIAGAKKNEGKTNKKAGRR